MLYFEDYISRLTKMSKFIKKKKKNSETLKIQAKRVMIMYPTSVISAMEVGALNDIINQEDFRCVKNSL